MSRFTVCYDIASDRRRRQVARALLEYGRRIQWSVFEIEVEPADVAELRVRLGSLLAKTDRFDFFPLDTRRPEARVSWQRRVRPDAVVFLGPFPPADRYRHPESDEPAQEPAGRSEWYLG